MSTALSALLELLELERIERDLFRGQSQDLGWKRVFGGQVLAQALVAAENTVPEERSVHSLHGYFLRPGDAALPIVFEVDRIRDGRSFTTRRVVAIQNGAAILNLSASFQVLEPGFDHQAQAPDSSGPDGVVSERELALTIADRIPEWIRQRAIAEGPFELRPVDPVNLLAPRARPPLRSTWFRATGELPERQSLHRRLLAYASDFHFLTASMQPHAVSLLTPGMQVASIDHAMWFHRPFRMDQWLLYAVDSPSASGARGLVRGAFFDLQGRLVASTAQEGLIRKRG